MLTKANLKCVFVILLAICCLVQCKNKHKHTVVKKEIVKKPEDMDDQVSDNIREALSFAKDNNGKIDDSIKLFLTGVVSSFYEKNDYNNIWSDREKWLPLADSMFNFIGNAKYYGLYPADYHIKELKVLRKKLTEDSLTRTDAIAWTKADLMLSDAFMKTAKDIKEGRLLPDSVSIINKEKYIDSFFIRSLNDAAKKNNSIQNVFNSMEPLNNRYQLLRSAVKNFVDSMNNTAYQYVDYPQKDSMNFIKGLQKRLAQSGDAKENTDIPDSVLLSIEIKKYQASHGMKKDGKISPKLITSLNNTDVEKFRRIAVTLDRYKKFPDSLPVRYIWVNIPSYYLEVWDHDTVAIRSKIVVGKPDTRTPVLSSSISDMITYPQWTIPESIIKKDILPAMKKDAGYLARKGFNLVDNKGDVVDPYKVKWAKYSKGIPWKIMQGSGDDNALGIFKFNFNNPYSVYLHDTNQRYLFKSPGRALSHGCVRVQKWDSLAYYIARNDSLNNTKNLKLSYNVDSIKTWIAKKTKKRIMVRSRLPLFIEYITCDVKDDKLVFFEDVYNDDKMLAQKYFANK